MIYDREELDALNEKYTEQLELLKDCEDFEFAHSKADDILCKLLNELGCGTVVEAWGKVGKWYA
jgi:hypothetical protein